MEDVYRSHTNFHFVIYRLPGIPYKSIVVLIVSPSRLQLQKSEDVHVELAPGTYAVTAGQWGAPRGHTQVVRLDPGQTVDMTFTCR